MDLQICNMALAFLGIQGLRSAEEQSPEGRACKMFYPAALQQVLRDHPWNFAERREYLVPHPLPLEWSREYTHAYIKPLACVQLLFLIDTKGSKEKVFRLANDGAKTIIVCFVPKAIGAFTSYMVDASLFDPLFKQALARKLQSLLVKPLLKNNTHIVREAEDLYMRELLRAKAADAKEGELLTEGESYWNGGHSTSATSNPWAYSRLRSFD